MPTEANPADCWVCWALQQQHGDTIRCETMHQVIRDWHACWAGAAGWARKQALRAQKMDRAKRKGKW